jgi:hypothetical protein
MTSARVPCEAIKRYPVVARWRNDVDYVAAGIYCFQPYCVTGELDPPANPLICPQFCVRFNDLDNIGLTGRHYSGFIMLGIQVFNYPDKHVFFKDECVEFNFRWLTEELGIEPDEITFIEDVWAGGGNLGPSIEYFVRGLEVGNMVFMQYKTFHDGSREELAIKIIDYEKNLAYQRQLLDGSALQSLPEPNIQALLKVSFGREIEMLDDLVEGEFELKGRYNLRDLKFVAMMKLKMTRMVLMPYRRRQREHVKGAANSVRYLKRSGNQLIKSLMGLRMARGEAGSS